MRRRFLVIIALLAVLCMGNTRIIPRRAAAESIHTFTFSANACGSVAGFLGIGPANCGSFAYLSGDTVIASAGTLKNLACDAVDPTGHSDGDGYTWTAWVDMNGYNDTPGAADTGITCDSPTAESSSPHSCVDTANTYAVIPGALVAIRTTVQGTPNNTEMTCSLELHL